MSNGKTTPGSNLARSTTSEDEPTLYPESSCIGICSRKLSHVYEMCPKILTALVLIKANYNDD